MEMWRKPNSRIILSWCSLIILFHFKTSYFLCWKIITGDHLPPLLIQTGWKLQVGALNFNRKLIWNCQEDIWERDTSGLKTQAFRTIYCSINGGQTTNCFVFFLTELWSVTTGFHQTTCLFVSIGLLSPIRLCNYVLGLRTVEIYILKNAPLSAARATHVCYLQIAGLHLKSLAN